MLSEFQNLSDSGFSAIQEDNLAKKIIHQPKRQCEEGVTNNLHEEKDWPFIHQTK